MRMMKRVALESSKRIIVGPILHKSSETSFIKPATPTPPHLGRYNLSSRDINTHNYYMPLLLFFPTSKEAANESLVSYGLKRSLSQTLTQYYPFAGRLISDQSYVDCHDQGVEFHEAQVKCKMFDLIHGDKDCDDDYDRLAHLFPPGSVWGEPSNLGGPLMIVQLNRFECGGMAMAVCMSHRITDGAGLSSFLKHWAAVSSQSAGAQHNLTVEPHLVSWPPRENVDGVLSTNPQFNRSRRNWITKTFVFQNSSLARLKKTVANHGVENPTRVELVSALVYSIAINAAPSTGFSPSILFMPANLRAKFMLPETTVGNFNWAFIVEAREQGDLALHKLNQQMKYGKMRLRNMEVKDMEGEGLRSESLKAFEYVKGDNCGLYVCSSLCKYPLNKVDFGWGEPIKVSIGDGFLINHFVLMDTPRGDGIEAMVCLGEEHMCRFQCDQHIASAADYTK